MNRAETEKRLRHGLQVIADRPSPRVDDAWEKLARAIDDGHAEVSPMREADAEVSSRPRPALVVAIVVTFLVAASWSVGSPSPQTPTSR